MRHGKEISQCRFLRSGITHISGSRKIRKQIKKKVSNIRWRGGAWRKTKMPRIWSHFVAFACISANKFAAGMKVGWNGRARELGCFLTSTRDASIQVRVTIASKYVGRRYPSKVG